MWVVIFARNPSNLISVWNGICFCYIHPKSISLASTVMQHVQIKRSSMHIYWVTTPENHSHVASVAKILRANTIWIGIFCTRAVTNRERNKKPLVMYAVNYLVARTIYANIFVLILDNPHGNVIISVHIVRNHFMVRHCWSKFVIGKKPFECI